MTEDRPIYIIQFEEQKLKGRKIINSVWGTYDTTLENPKYINKFDNMDEINKFLEKENLQKLTE